MKGEGGVGILGEMIVLRYLGEGGGGRCLFFSPLVGDFFFFFFSFVRSDRFLVVWLVKGLVRWKGGRQLAGCVKRVHSLS